MLQLRQDQRRLPPELAEYSRAPKRIASRRRLHLIAYLAPLALLALYLFALASERYVSQVGVSVRSDVSGDLVPQVTLPGLSGGSDPFAAIVFDYLTSRDLVARLSSQLELEPFLHPSQFDPVYAQKPASLENLHKRWNRIVVTALDSRSGIISLEVRSFSPDLSLDLSRAIVAETSAMIDRLSASAHIAATQLARSNLDQAEQRQKQARRALTEFRLRSQTIDPVSKLESHQILATGLVEQLIEAKMALLVLKSTAKSSDTRLTQAEKRVEILSALLDQHRQDIGPSNNGLAAQTGTFEALLSDVEYANGHYLAAKAAHDAALLAAQQNTRYLALHIEPVPAENPSFPRIWETLLVGALAWGFAYLSGALIIAGIKEQI